FQTLVDAAALLEHVVSRNPDYAPAWALLAQAYDKTPQYHPAARSGTVEELRRVVDELLPKARVAAERALQLDRDLADAHVAMALVQRDSGKLILAGDLFKQVLALDPNNPDALHWYSDLIAGAGRLKEALAMRQRLLALEPFVPVFTGITAAQL